MYPFAFVISLLSVGGVILSLRLCRCFWQGVAIVSREQLHKNEALNKSPTSATGLVLLTYQTFDVNLHTMCIEMNVFVLQL